MTQQSVRLEIDVMSYSNSYFVKFREDPTDDLLFKGYYLTQQFWGLKFGTKFGILQFALETKPF